MHDLKFALRQLLKNPGFTAVAVLTLALGIGANTEMFGLLDELMLRPLPVKDPESLLAIVLTDHDGDFANQSIPYPIVRDYEENDGRVLNEFAAYATTLAPAEINGDPQYAFVELATPGYFPMLGAVPKVGRFFDESDTRQPQSGTVAVLSHATWQQWFGADPNVIGRMITFRPAYVEPFSCTIVGVASEGFTGLARTPPQIWLPAVMEKQFKDASRVNFRMVGRLADGIGQRRAEAALDVLASAIAQKHGGQPTPGYANEGIFGSDLRTELRHAALGSWGAFRPYGPIRRARLLAFGIAGLVLLIACANIANLLLIRAERRRKETAIRVSLGAGRGRLLRAALVESLLLSLLGGAAGLFLAYAGNRLLLGFRPEGVEFLVRTQLDYRVGLFCIAIAMIAGLMVGLIPAWRGSRTDPNLALKGSPASSTPGRLKLWDGFAITQLALSLVLLISAGLCLRSFRALLATDPGFSADKLLVAQLNFQNVPEANGPAHYRALVAQLSVIHSVKNVSWTRSFPLLPRQGFISTPVDQIEGYEKRPNEFINVQFTEIAPEYFKTMGMPVSVMPSRPLSGAAPLVWVNEAFVRRYWPDGKAVGRHIGDWIVDGIVKDASVKSLWEPAIPYVYRQLAEPDARSGIFVIRTEGDPQTVLNPVRSQLKAMAPDLDFSSLMPMRTALSDTLGGQKFTMLLLSLFAGCAVLLAVVGVYGVASYLVNQRKREIGIRMALGARRRAILFLVLRHSATLTALGIAAGLACSWAATRLLGHALFEIGATDSITFIGVGSLLAASALAACLLPARRAANVHPMEALRNE